ncbi:MAG TPA: D-arabinono-1,4-lactone oxidase [Steroidobacteraceae bacterium]
MSVSRRTAIALGIGAAATAIVGTELGRQWWFDREPPSPPLRNQEGNQVWINWSGCTSSYPAVRSAPGTEAELAELLRKTPAPIRPVGAGHSFTSLVPTEGTLLSLDQLSGIVEHDPVNHMAAVWAGTRLGDLGPALASIGQEMLSLPDINKQSLGGALSTATHGTGTHYQALHGSVVKFRLATAGGDILECSAQQNPEIFAAARVGLGAFGVITQVTLQNDPVHRVRKRTFIQSTEKTVSEWETLCATHRKVEFFAVPFTGLSAVITTDPTDEAVIPRGPDQDTESLMSLKRLRDLAGWAPPLRHWIAQAALTGMPEERAIDYSWKLLSNERPVRFNEMEFHLPRETQMAAMRQVLELIEANHREVFFPLELRSIAKDDAWLSPFYDRDSGSIAVHAYYKDDHKRLFAQVEPILRRHGGRPHWGKLHSLKARDLAALYPRWQDAMKVRQTLDPQGRFLNGYLRELFIDG